MRFFLTGKSWQVFIVLIMPIIIQAVFTPAFNAMQLFGLIWFAFMAIYLLWLYTIGIFANNNVPGDLRKHTYLYKSCLSLPLFYAVLLNIYFFPNLELGQGTTPPFWLIPLHLLSMLGIFYGLLFTAKSLVTLHRSENVGFFEYSGAFFLFWFFPIGIWFLQPRVNQLYKKNVTARDKP